MLSRSFALPHHELTRFGTGNEETLRSSLPALRAFHSKHYTATHAAVAVVGPSSLDELQAVAVAAFGHMPKHTVSLNLDEFGDGDSVLTSTGAPLSLQPYLFAGGTHSPGLQVLFSPFIFSIHQTNEQTSGWLALAIAVVGFRSQFGARVH